MALSLAPCQLKASCLGSGSFSTARPRSLTSPAAARPAAARRQQLCRAAVDDKEGSSTQQTAGQPAPPAAPPAPTGSEEQRRRDQLEAMKSPVEPTMTIEEIQQKAGMLRQQRAAAAAGKESFAEGVGEEVRLIKWPAPVGAVLNTVLVIGIVAGTAATLLGINGLLTEVSTLIY